MNILAPSILSADFCELGKQIEEIEKAGAQYLHVDVMDGIFVPSISFGMPIVSSVRPRTKMFMDVHMMVTRPERYVEEFIQCGADGVTIHEEACDCVAETLCRIREAGAQAGLAINPETPVEKLYPYLDKMDMALIMTVHPGFGGQKYIPYTTQKIRDLKKMMEEKHCQADIEVDGGVSLNNVQEVLDAGANIIVAGTAVFKGDIRENVESFLNIMEK